MNRTIKFRAWSTSKEGFVFLSLNGRGSFEWDSLYPHEPTLQQFTDLLDSKGVPIYEGDIVEWTSGAKLPSGPQKYTEEVQYNQNSASFRMSKSHLSISFCGVDIRVVGNIFEHKHLLS